MYYFKCCFWMRPACYIYIYLANFPGCSACICFDTRYSCSWLLCWCRFVFFPCLHGSISFGLWRTLILFNLFFNPHFFVTDFFLSDSLCWWICLVFFPLLAGQISERFIRMGGRRAARPLLLSRGDPAQVAGPGPTRVLALTHSDPDTERVDLLGNFKCLP